MTFWAVFRQTGDDIPAHALAIELGCYFYAISEKSKDADSTVLHPLPRSTRKFSKMRGNAQPFVTSNTTGLSAKGVYAFLKYIQVNGGCYSVRAEVSADLTILFPSVIPKSTDDSNRRVESEYIHTVIKYKFFL